MSSLLDYLAADLDKRQTQGLMRQRRLLDSPQAEHITANGQAFLSFCSNDYLGLANDPALVAALQAAATEAGVGSGASNLITGHHRYHDQLEQALAAFVGKPSALLFSTGYMANIGVISALMGRDDAVFSDKLNHACLNDGAFLSRATHHRFAHNDVAALEKLLQASTARHKLVTADAVFSMDGDIAPLADYLSLCERYDAYLYVDDAHGFGVLGPQGRGTLQHLGLASPRLIMMGTLGKAAGVAGAFVAAEKIVIDYLIQHANSYIYTTPAPPPLSAALLASLHEIETGDARRQQLFDMIALLKRELALTRWHLQVSETAIQPLIVGDNHEALALSHYLQLRGILVPAIRPPTVPLNTARLRISLSAAHGEADVRALISALHAAEREIPVGPQA
ncbi:8-amino-7-oxononanoate synthase [Methylophilus medardicus]|uniref:8-amino-7-oxononanoate synthase n=1 Tax=Methylophilus medardicus TaxID=2588534 RepID=A0A5B8CQF1_9PROT|nr:8-amino-7-oxononanoate synthase [Methylophilus medardicus]QDC43439.1 8-amino-7-oxononanoate synthase [Methylophilus medardicus]QDC48446.1 8-amino-7-oxononanoate synthase [Methylophilus medardicus]QDC52151.1 8-amino-7-oxononanoate synthase [Methylophilus medardicus]